MGPSRKSATAHRHADKLCVTKTPTTCHVCNMVKGPVYLLAIVEVSLIFDVRKEEGGRVGGKVGKDGSLVVSPVQSKGESGEGRK